MEETKICCACELRQDENPSMDFIKLEDGTYICMLCIDEDSDIDTEDEHPPNGFLDF